MASMRERPDAWARGQGHQAPVGSSARPSSATSAPARRVRMRRNFSGHRTDSNPATTSARPAYVTMLMSSAPDILMMPVLVRAAALPVAAQPVVLDNLRRRERRLGLEMGEQVRGPQLALQARRLGHGGAQRLGRELRELSASAGRRTVM